MKFAIDQINNSTSLLPGVKLGYDIYDTCFEPLAALQPSLLFLTRNGTTGIGVVCNYTNYQPRVTAVIGPHKSDLCLVTAKLFSFFLIPQVKRLCKNKNSSFWRGRDWIEYNSSVGRYLQKSSNPTTVSAFEPGPLKVQIEAFAIDLLWDLG